MTKKTQTNQETKIDLNKLNHEELVQLAEVLQTLDTRKKYNKQEFLFLPEQHDKYKKHILFFEAGALYKERALIAGNRTGKTYTAEAEVSYHLNGRYPSWWVGKRFYEPIRAWEVGKTHETTKEILQGYLLGDWYDQGTGMIPKEDLEKVTSKQGLSGAANEIYVKHHTNGVYDGLSKVAFKSYIQGVEAFMGDAVHVIHLDEEPDSRDIYSECLTRTMTTDGIIICTFTPLMGLSEVVLSFLKDGKFPEGGIGPVEGN